jgi:hypothetical protein
MFIKLSGVFMETELLTTDELSARIKYDSRTIRERLKDSVLIEGVHYFRPFGGRKILYVWATIQRDMRGASPSNVNVGACIPMSAGRMLHA